MINLIIAAFIFQYILCSILCYGFFHGSEYRNFRVLYNPRDRGHNIVLGIIFGFFSIFGVFITYRITGFADGGFKW